MEKQNRVRVVDFGRGLSVLMMIPIHVLMLFATVDTWENSFTGSFGQLLERGSPSFLIAMGISFAFSKKSNRNGILKKALLIIALGYVLNFLRFIVPILFFGGFPQSFVEASGLEMSNIKVMMDYLLKGDMFQLVGLSLFLIGLSYNFLTKNKYVIIILCLAILWLSKTVSGIQLGIPVIDYLLTLVWGNNFDVYFPLFPWMAFILIGLFLGLNYQEKNNYVNKGLALPSLYIGLIFAIIGKLLCDYNYEYHFGDYYHLGPGGALGLMGVLLVMLWIIYHIERLLPKDNLVSKLFFYCSKNVTKFYILQWVLIYWLLAFTSFSMCSELTVISIIIGINIGTFGLLYLLNKALISRNERKKRTLQATI
ncbi:hypothetical protein BTO06_07230 [Tenacibaculum sp. SZ-18]|uniref:heparan-alpha-glucosaminide N-acetyltransferase domain-containing protein n=1 Tax=Tenacibaculum sp. SZ-18 TaxID=754423 RepID=UPI000C2D3C40|nr:heparan-alpha-glucosaminide N-acetyltransferase domain-containing protein [Tenacibaculum sp. SZ-18]AUC14940.1 hypothetical protein BTO06_07230 [Tenacibaculum sp. SZ-18]